MVSLDTVEDGAHVLLYASSRRTWLVRAEKGRKLHTHVGFVDLGSLIGEEYGSRVISSLGTTLWALRPTIEDFVMKGERRTQVVYPKDMGLITAKAGISSGSVVVEAGTGSGILTTFLANLVKPDGHVYSYEVRPEFLEIAKKNLEKAGLSRHVTLVCGDAREVLEVTSADAGIIDVGDPWTLVEPVKRALKGGGVVVSISPTMNQVEKMVAALMEHGFVAVESLEVIVRGLEARAGMTRPAMRMVGHTAYLTFGRRTV